MKAFVQMHGGQIDVDSQPERGTTFTITLPGTSGNAERPTENQSSANER